MWSGIAHTVQRLLGSRHAGWIIVLIAIAARAFQLVYFYNIRVDASFQVLATQHLVHGQGISLASVDPADLSKTIYEPLINWPPGYSLLLAPFYLLFGENYIAAGITLDLLAAALLIFAARRILRHLELPLYAINGYTLLSCFFIYYFYFIASSDAIAISVFIYAIALAQESLDKKSSPLRLAAIALLLALVASIKYLFIPAVFVVPASLLLFGYLRKEAFSRRAGWTVGVLLLAAVGALLFYQQSVSGTTGYISQPQRGIYPDHLLDFYPFIPASFLQPQTVGLLTGLPSETGSVLYRGYQWIHAALLLVWILWLLRGSRRPVPDATGCFAWLSFLLCMAVTLVLLLLSFLVAREEILPGFFWTYAEEARYYGICFVLLQLLLFVTVFRRTPVFPGRKMGLVLLLLLLIESGRGLVFTGNRLLASGREEYSWQTEQRFQRYAAGLLPRELSGKRIIIAGSTYYMNHRVALETGHPVLYESSLLNRSNWPASTPVQVLVIIRDGDAGKFGPFLQKHGRDLRGRWADYSFYLVGPALHEGP